MRLRQGPFIIPHDSCGMRLIRDDFHRKDAPHFIRLPMFEASSDQIHFIFEINVGKSRIRHITTLKLNDEFLDRVKID